jgi:hypothetical protein
MDASTAMVKVPSAELVPEATAAPRGEPNWSARNNSILEFATGPLVTDPVTVVVWVGVGVTGEEPGFDGVEPGAATSLLPPPPPPQAAKNKLADRTERGFQFVLTIFILLIYL